MLFAVFLAVSGIILFETLALHIPVQFLNLIFERVHKTGERVMFTLIRSRFATRGRDETQTQTKRDEIVGCRTLGQPCRQVWT